MRVNLQVRRDSGYHVDTLDLYAARSRAAYIKQASVELGLPVLMKRLKRDLGFVLLKLETLQDELIRSQSQAKAKQITLTAEQEKAALHLLQAPI